MFSKINSVGLFGIDSYMIEVEADISNGLPAFDIVGLPDAAVKESRDRVRAAIKNCGFKFPVSRITVNLAPADRKKEGSIYDLPVLLSILKASGQISVSLDNTVVIGEVALDGMLRAVNGVLAIAITAKENGIENLFVPKDNAVEAAVVDGLNIYGVENVKDLILHLKGEKLIEKQPLTVIKSENNLTVPDFSDVKGQLAAKKAMEIAAAGGHNIILVGPPGSGKSMLAKRLPGIMPDMTFDEAIETTKIHSVAGILDKNEPFVSNRPFRSPHHTVSPAAIAGGGTMPRPGEISLAHNGVLFLDEFPEFDKNTTEILRQPLEDGSVTITRVSGRITYPSKFMLVAAMNPCKCGYYGHLTKPCTCTPAGRLAYINKISGPLLDRIDIQIELPSLSYSELSDNSGSCEKSEDVRARVIAAREFARERMKGDNYLNNASLDSAGIRKYCKADEDAMELLHMAYDSMGLSARGYDRIMRVARTIADLDKSEIIRAGHIAEAIQFRSLDRKYWGTDDED